SPGRKPPAQLRINNVTETAGWNLALPPPSLAGLAVASATGRLGHFWKAHSGQFWRAPKYSLAETAARARQLGMELSAVALFKLLRASEEWLRWLAEQQRSKQPVAVESQGRPVRLVDATTGSEPGSTGTDWGVHYVVNLANLQCDFFELTDVKGGETLRRIPIRPGDIMLGDRDLCHASRSSTREGGPSRHPGATESAIASGF